VTADPGRTAAGRSRAGSSSGRRSSTRAANHLVDALDRAGERVTGPRRAVAGLVLAHDGHFTAAEVVEDARRCRPAVGRATVFRSLDLFTTLGLVERVDLPGGEHAYVVCDSVHHHHAICTSCGRSFDVHDAGLAGALEAIGDRSGFRVTAHRLEIFGICGACATTGRGRP
jgi:Fur family transcriptional regulator, ferric uptake regulator